MGTITRLQNGTKPKSSGPKMSSIMIGILFCTQAIFITKYVSSSCGSGGDLIIEVGAGAGAGGDKAQTTLKAVKTPEQQRIETETETSTSSNHSQHGGHRQISTDPFFETVDCRSLLDDFRNKKIPKMAGNEYVKSYIRSSREDPFFVSTHSNQIDPVRGTVFDTGAYYEKKLTNIIRETFQAESEKPGANKNKKPIMLDVGGNIGWFSLVAATYGAQVYYFEPNIVNNVRFCESRTLNGWVNEEDGAGQQQTVLQFMKGVGNEHATELSFYTGGSAPGAAEGNPGKFTFNKPSDKYLNSGVRKAVGTLQLITLDALAEDQGWFKSDGQAPTIAFMKVDVEGFEQNVFKGAKKLLSSGLVKNIELELKHENGLENVREIVKILLESGFKLHMHGKYMGPAREVTETYDSWEKLADDVMAKKYSENVWFKHA